jgi:hypothetical protein
MAADPLSLIPAGPEYDELRFTLRILRRDFPDKYAGFVNQEARVQGWVDEVDRVTAGTGGPNDRNADQIRDDIVRYVIRFEGARDVYGLSQAEFEQLILGGNEGGIDLNDQTPIVPPPVIEPPEPPPPEEPEIPEIPEDPEPEPIDFERRVAELYPWLPPELVKVFADAWAETGDQEQALARMRADPLYDQFFPGNRRDDGSLRMSEAEWFSTREAYRRLFIEFGLNPDLFEGRFQELMEGEVSPTELAGRLGGAYERIITNIPQVKEFYARMFGLEMTDAAIFASFLDPDISAAILDRSISIAQVGGEGLARGFDVTDAFAGRLADAGVDQLAARQLFTDAEGRVPTLNELARRFSDPDSDFDIEEFADVSIFGDATQRRRIRRLFASESSLFSDQFGAVATSDEFAVTGITAR